MRISGSLNQRIPGWWKLSKRTARNGIRPDKLLPQKQPLSFPGSNFKGVRHQGVKSFNAKTIALHQESEIGISAASAVSGNKRKGLILAIIAALLQIVNGGVLETGAVGCSKKASNENPAATSPAEEPADQTDYSSLSLSTLFQQATEAAASEKSYEKAISQLEAIIEKCPNSDLSLIAHLRIGYIYAQYLEDYAKAIEFYQKVVGSKPKTPWAAHALFEIAGLKVYKMKKYQEGIQIYEQIIQDFPEEEEWVAAALLSIGEVHLYFINDKEKASEYFEKVGHLFPNSEFARIAKEGMRTKALSQEDYMENCELGLLEYCEQLNEIFPGIKWGKIILFQKGVNFFYRNEFGKAVELLQKSLQIQVEIDEKFNTQAQFYGGMSFYYLGEYDKALNLLLEAEQSIDGRLNGRRTVAPEKAFDLEYYYPWLKSHVDSVIGKIYSQVKNDKAQALKYYARAAEGINNNYFVSFYAVNIMFEVANGYAYEIGDYKKAEEIYKRIKNYRFTPNDLRRNAHLELGNLYYRKGEVNLALSAFREIIRSNPNDSFSHRARLAIGFIHFKNGDREKAEQTWSEVSEDSLEKNTARLLKNLYQLSSTYSLVGQGQFGNEISYEAYQNQVDNKKLFLIFLHGFPATYIPGRIEMVNEILKAEYDSGFSVEFHVPLLSIAYNNLILTGTEKIPGGFFRNSLIIFPSPEADDIIGGKYDNDKAAVSIYPPQGLNLGTLLHELTHFFDLSLTGSWFDPLDPSNLFTKISFYQLGKQYWWKQHGYSGFEMIIMGAITRLEREDMPNLSTYYFGKAAWLRKQARKQMKKGDFDLAAKYLFIRYLTPFDGREYDLSNRDPSLGFEEVERAIATHPERIDQSTVDIIQEIKERWQKEQTELTCQDTVEW